MEAAAEQRRPGVVTLRVIDGASVTDVPVKWCMAGDTVQWELRSPFRYILGKPLVRVAQLVRVSLAPCWRFLQQSGCDEENLVRHSHKSASAQRDDDLEGLDKEFTASGTGFVGMLAWMCQCRRLHAEQVRANNLLVSFLRHFINDPRAVLQLCKQVPHAIRVQCRAGVDERSDMCTHVTSFGRRVSTGGQDVDEHERVAQWLVAFVETLTETPCRALGSCFRHMIDGVSAAVVRYIDGRAAPSIKELEQNVLEGPVRKLRVDTDFKLAVLSKVAKKDRMMITSVLSDYGDATTAQTAHWLTEYLHSYVMAMHQRFAEARSITLTPDASRLGNPAEETVVYPIYAADLGVGGWCAPQVP